MNRRILLIDSDPAFKASLTKQLAKFQFDIVHEPDGDKAHAAAVADLPALAIVAVDEPEKLGFKIFQKLKKGATSKVPLMLATSSMTPESFAKHKALKVHADEYLDKRTQGDELLGKIEALIGLGDPIEEDIDVPMEVDEIALGDGDMVLEETLGEDDVQEFDDPHNQGTRNMQVDSLVDAEIDAGFAAMFGDDDAPAAPAREPKPSIPIPVEVVPESIPMPIVEEPALAADSFEEEHVSTSQPAIIDDDGVAGVGSRAEGRGGEIDDDLAINSMDMIPIEELNAAVEAEEKAAAAQQFSAIPEAVPEPVAAPVVEEEEDAEKEFSQHDVATRAAPVSQKLLDELSIPVPVAHASRPTGDTMAPPIVRPEARTKSPTGAPIVDLGLDELAVRAESEQSGVHDRRSLQRVGELERQVAQLKTELDRAKAAPAASGGSPGRDFVHLREQITQKDKELLAARNEAAQAQNAVNAAQDKAKAAAAKQQSAESKLADLEQRLATGQTQIQTLENREKALADQVAALKQEVDARGAQVASADQARLQIERDLAAERARSAAGASEAERSLRVEREQLINRQQGEIAAVRAEQEKLRDAALASLKAELEADGAVKLASAVSAVQNKAIATAEKVKAEQAAAHADEKAELAAAHAQALEGVKAASANELEQLKAQYATELEALTAEHGEALTAASAGSEAMQKQHADALARARSAHDEALDKARADAAAAATAHAEELARLQSEHANAIAQQKAAGAEAQETARAGAEAAEAARAQELAALRAEHAKALEALRAEHAEAAESARAGASAAAEEVAALKAEHQKALNAVRAEISEAQDTARAGAEAAQQQHVAELKRLAQENADALAAAREDANAKIARALSEHANELETLRAQHELKQDQQRRELENAAQGHETAKAQLTVAHTRATEQLQAAHNDELARIAAEVDGKLAAAQDQADRETTALRQTLAAAKRANEEQKAAHEQALATQREDAARESAESRAALVAAKREAEAQAKQHEQALAAATTAHEQAIAEQKATHERALAVANGDFVKQKAVGDAEAAKALAAARDEAAAAKAALEAEHARVQGDLIREREELSKGLSSAREQTKRVDTELASAVQTIADRNAELRNHATAISERDARIAELRKELESLEAENASYQEQVLRAYQKIKTDEAMVARAKKAMAIALTVLDEPPSQS